MECQDVNLTDPSHCMAEGADAPPERSSIITVEADTGEDLAENPAPPEADERPLKADPAKAYRRHIKNAPATLQALEGREREVKGLEPDYAQEIATLERLQVMNRKLLRQMRPEEGLREVRPRAWGDADQRDDLAATWME